MFRRLLILLVAMAAAVLAIWAFWAPEKTGSEPRTTEGAGGDRPGPTTLRSLPNVASADDRPAPATATATAAAPARPAALSAEQAREALDRGNEMLKANDVIGARTELSNALLSDRLPAKLADETREALESLARVTLFSKSVYPKDPYTGYYTVKPGERLAGAQGVVRKLDLRVPEELIVRINGLARAQDIQGGRKYKILRGPFHAVVHKDNFVMDLLLQRDDLPAVFVDRLPVGIGKDGSTPTGRWRVRRAGKEVHPTWYPPPNSPIRGPVHYGDPDYAFGAKGLWIAMEGIDEGTASLTNYGIHSTNDPATVGIASSLGCIRLKDGDIDLVFSLLYPVHSLIQVLP